MKVKKVEFKVNPIYLEKLFPCQKRYGVLMGGAGSGKSVAAAQKILLRLKTEFGHRFLVVRKVASTIRDSVYRLLCDLIDMYDLHSEFTILKSEFKIVHKSGNEILFYGLDDSEKIKSIAGITGIFVEEATELEESDLAQLDMRLRGQTDYYKQILLCFNPISEDHWLKARFFDQEDNDTLTLVTTFHDNAFIDDEYKMILSEKYKTNENMYRVYCLGLWGRINAGDCFYKNFDYSKHSEKLQYDPELALGVSFDFNTQPFCACVIFQIQGKRFAVIDEITLKSPKNTLSDTCKEFKRRYFNHQAGVNVYGDASGKNDDSKYEKGFNCFTLISKDLEHFKPVIRVGTRNPPVMIRGLFINNILGNPNEIEIVIDEKCKHLLNDFTYGKEAEDGGKAKTMYKDKETGATYQKYFHCADAFDYGFCYVHSQQFSKFQKGGEKPKMLIGSTRDFNSEHNY
jgi:phage terminase large subunit